MKVVVEMIYWVEIEGNALSAIVESGGLSPTWEICCHFLWEQATPRSPFSRHCSASDGIIESRWKILGTNANQCRASLPVVFNVLKAVRVYKNTCWVRKVRLRGIKRPDALLLWKSALPHWITLTLRLLDIAKKFCGSIFVGLSSPFAPLVF